MNYLASPPLVVAYALAGPWTSTCCTSRWAPTRRRARAPAATCGPTAEVQDVIDATWTRHVHARLRRRIHRRRPVAGPWTPRRRHVRLAGRLHLPPPPAVPGRHEPQNPRPLRMSPAPAHCSNSVTPSPPTTSPPPAPSRRAPRPGAVPPRPRGVPHGFDLNTTPRRGNHEVMMRGCFANVRLRNQLVPGVEGGADPNNFLDDTTSTAIYDAALAYRAAGTPLLVIAGQGLRQRVLQGLGSERPSPARDPSGPRRIVRTDPPVQPGSAGRCCRCSSPPGTPPTTLRPDLAGESTRSPV